MNSEHVPHVIFLPLSRGLFATIDSSSPESIWGVKWTAYEKRPGRIYAFRSHNGKHLKLHQVVLDISGDGMEADHINGDTLDTRKQNLRACRHCQNGRNLSKWNSPTSSKFKGVSQRPNGGWRAYIVFEGKQKHLGIFSVEAEAAKAYDAAAKEAFGEYAKTNF